MFVTNNELLKSNSSKIIFKIRINYLKSLLGLIILAPFLGFCEVVPKKYSTSLLTSELKIDGLPNDAAWKSASVADKFTQLDPVEGAQISQNTEVRVLYDNAAIYILAEMHDTHADSILHELGNRDEGYNLNSDAFRFGVDPYNKRQNGYVFEVSASGVQSEYFDDDISFNAVWQSAVTMSDTGWVAEIKIPYSAIRFPAASHQEWGCQFARLIRRSREYDQWTLTPKNVQNKKLYWGTMDGINNINPPLRLSLTPYLSSYVERAPVVSDSGSTSYQNSYSYSGGADIKYGIDERFTLDMTLLPDFSQVQSDNKVKNLSAFETIYDENRPFFNEGTALLSKGRLLYTRRIGSTPSLYYNVPDMLLEGETLEKNPDKAKLQNATKLSGRTDGGLGIGLLNAVTSNTYAIIKDSQGNKRKILTEPLSNFNLFIFDQQLKNNCNIFLVNSNVMREGKERDANVTTASGTFENSTHLFKVNGSYSASHVYQWTEKETEDSKKENIKGELISIKGDKISGNSYYGIRYEQATKNYDKNDLGFNFTNDYTEIHGYYTYNKFNPFLKYFKRGDLTFYANREGRLSSQNVITSLNLGVEFFALFNNNWSLNAGWGLNPVDGRDYYEPRIEGLYYNNPKGNYGNINVSTDYNKILAFDFGGRYYTAALINNLSYGYYFSPRVRFSDHFTITLNNRFDTYNNEYGFAYTSEGNDSSYFGHRDVITIENTITSRYIFKNDMSLSFSARHYWSNGKYENFFLLNSDGNLSTSSIEGNSDYDFNSNYLTVDIVYNWQFAPGSSFIVTYKNLINSETSNSNSNYFSNLSHTFSDPQTNSVSLKFLYYLDYQYFVSKKS